MLFVSRLFIDVDFRYVGGVVYSVARKPIRNHLKTIYTFVIRPKLTHIASTSFSSRTRIIYNIVM